MTQVNTIAEAKQVLAQTEEMVSRIEQNQWADKMVAPDVLRNTQNEFIQHIEECEEGEFEFDSEDFSAMVLFFIKDIMLADKILLSI